jgi:hypothetical protein
MIGEDVEQPDLIGDTREELPGQCRNQRIDQCAIWINRAIPTLGNDRADAPDVEQQKLWGC